MPLLRDSDPRFRWLGWRVGAFVLIGLGMALALLVVLGLRQGYFVPKTQLHFVAEHGAGLTPGMQVRLSGFKVGVVDAVSLNEQAKVDVDLLVEARYIKWIKPDSMAILQQDGLIGDHYIEIAGGSPNQAPIKEGGRLTFAPALGLSEIALDLRQRIVPVIDSVQTTLDIVNDPNGDLRQTLANVRGLTAELRETRASVDQLIVNLNALSSRDLPAVAQTGQQALARVDAIAAELQGRMPTMLDRIDGTLQHASRAASEAEAMMVTTRRAVDAAAPRLPSILRNGDAVLQTSRDALDGASQSWPLKNWLPPADTSAPVPPSRP
ncbi:MlaD family protein [Jeongeupia chitinilytica]|uniref:Mammalian cell entry protein n=1 Tax=Jeongeupia chitinilytica TaxID=1041641 RepID=A0ABQ3GYP7_9NEIS|nr:MlaD family protein [Jeongeupia chitinilytica]GHD60149.1 mammalian cell entry protein [Jeongeupia chitinilytica]